MRFPITNKTDKQLEVFVEIECTSVTLAPNESVVVTTSDADKSYIEVADGLVVVMNEGVKFADVRVGDLVVKPSSVYPGS